MSAKAGSLFLVCQLSRWIVPNRRPRIFDAIGRAAKGAL
jgi:hypothetical protein